MKLLSFRGKIDEIGVKTIIYEWSREDCRRPAEETRRMAALDPTTATVEDVIAITGAPVWFNECDECGQVDCLVEVGVPGFDSPCADLCRVCARRAAAMFEEEGG